MKPSKMWDGRFSQKTDPEMEAFSQSLSFDRRLAVYDVRVNQAYAKALEKIGIFTKEELSKILSNLEHIAIEFQAGTFPFSTKDEDIHMAIERRLTELTGGVGAKIHTGRSRNDQVMTDVLLYLKEKNREAEKAVRRLQKTVIARAENHRTTVLPGYTHLQQAQPILLLHYMLSIFWALQRTAERLSENFARLDVLPLGSGALAGSAFRLDRRFLARELGFGKISANSLDAVSHRDVMTEFAGILTQLSVMLSRYAEDFILWSTQEFGFLTLSDAYSTGSSMMPQKKNPDSLELIRGKAATNIGHLSALLSLEKGLPLTYNRDLQEDKIHLFGILDNVLPTLRIFRGLLKTAVFNSKAMRSAVHPFTLATDLADYLTEKGLPFREAHRVIGALVRNCVETGKNLTDLSLEFFRSYSPLFEKDIFDWLTIEHSMNRRNLPGGTGPQAVDAAIKEANDVLNQTTEG